MSCAFSLRPPICHVILGFTHTTLYLFSVSVWTLAWGWFIALPFAVLIIALKYDRQTGIILYKLKLLNSIFTCILADEWCANKISRFPPKGMFIAHNSGKIWLRHEVWTWLIPKVWDKWLRCSLECADVQVCFGSVRQAGWSWNNGLPSLVSSWEN